MRCSVALVPKRFLGSHWCGLIVRYWMQLRNVYTIFSEWSNHLITAE